MLSMITAAGANGMAMRQTSVKFTEKIIDIMILVKTDEVACKAVMSGNPMI